jgi:hypothetical protein
MEYSFLGNNIIKWELLRTIVDVRRSGVNQRGGKVCRRGPVPLKLLAPAERFD